jgi:hypothetical protein
MKSKNLKIWQQFGLSAEDAVLADKLMPKMLEIAKGEESSRVLISALEEALFQIYKLPKETEEYQKEYTWRE